jgi:transposase
MLSRSGILSKRSNVLLDNLSAHKTPSSSSFSEAHVQVRLHFIPTYSSWLNQVEIWSAKIEHDAIARAVVSFGSGSG